MFDTGTIHETRNMFAIVALGVLWASCCHPHTPTPAQSQRQAWGLARDAAAAYSSAFVALDALAGSFADVLGHFAPTVPPEKTTLARNRLGVAADAEARLDKALQALQVKNDHVEVALVSIAVNYRRAQPGTTRTSIGAWKGDPSCQLDIAYDNVLLDHLQALAEGRMPDAAIFLSRLDHAIRCLSIYQVWDVDARLAFALNQTDATVASSWAPDERRSIRAHILPALIIVLDVSKALGQTRLLEHLSSHLGEYSDSFVLGGVLEKFGIWLHDSATDRILQFMNLCDVGTAPGCLHGAGLLQSFTTPELLGSGECDALLMVRSGATSEHGYACTRGACLAGANKTASPGLTIPAGVGHITFSGATRFGVELSPKEAATSCAGGGGGGGSHGDARPASPTQCAIAAVVGGKQGTAVDCAKASVVDVMGNHVSLPAIDLGGVRIPPGCTPNADEAADKSTPEQKKKDDDTKKEVAALLRDPAVQEEVRKQLNAVLGLSVDAEQVKSWCLAAAAHVEEATVQRDEKDGLPWDPASKGYTDPNTGDIDIDGDYADTAQPDAGGSAFGLLLHEAIHSLFVEMKLSGYAAASYGAAHEFMPKSGLACKYASREGCVNTPSEMCTSDEACASACTPQSKLATEILGCLAVAVDGAPHLGSPQAGAIDPNPLDAPQVDNALLKCFTGLHVHPTGSAACFAVDCGDGATAKLNGAGICACGGTAGGRPVVSGGGCMAAMCLDGMPTSGPFGCSCMGTFGGFRETPTPSPGTVVPHE
jgi:hypothetical protein